MTHSVNMKVENKFERIPSLSEELRLNQQLERTLEINMNELSIPNSPVALSPSDRLIAGSTKSEYSVCLDSALSQDFSSLARSNIFEIAGRDQQGREIVMVYAKNIPRGANFDTLFLFAISYLDLIVNEEYIIIYVNTDTGNDNRPAASLFQKKLSLLHRKYKKNIKAMYIIHPSVWVKLFTKLVKTSASDKFWSEKLIFLEDANRIHLLLGFDLELPNYVIQANAKFFPPRPVFCSSLEATLSLEKRSSDVPKVMEDCFKVLSNHVKVEGIFRLCGSSSEITSLAQSYDRREKVDLSTVNNPHTIADLLKLYLRRLPNSLIPTKSIDNFIAVHQKYAEKSANKWSRAMAKQLNELPIINRRVLKTLFDFIDQVYKQAELNKMSSTNLAVVIGPTVARILKTDPNIVEKTSMVNVIVNSLIENHDSIWVQVEI